MQHALLIKMNEYDIVTDMLLACAKHKTVHSWQVVSHLY